jgi:hypothetical protein
MARIASGSESRVFQISKWLGVNENPDGETGLRQGEASQMRNWRITKDQHLQIRPGYAPIAALGDGPVRGLWQGYIGGTAWFVASCGGKLWALNGAEPMELGALEGEHTHFFGFSEKLWILTGSKYYVFDGEALAEVEGYRPLISTANVPTGGGTLLEQVNKLSGARRAWFSPDGTATVFQLPEKALKAIDYVKKTADGTAVSFTANPAAGTVTFSAAPAKGTNSLEIGWTVSESFRTEVEAMRFSETYNGEADTRVFLYGDGSNTALYSGLDYNGRSRADYFPDLNEIAVDSANTPITAMIKHYDRLLTFKTDGAFITTFGTMTLADGAVTAAFYTLPLNRAIGNAAPGQAVLVGNNPLTLFGRSVYEWQLSNYASKDERNASPKSDRVQKSLSEMDLTKAVCYDDEYNTEYYVCANGKCAVYNYTADAWYLYDNIPATCFLSFGGALYFGSGDGQVMRISRSCRNDNGKEIDALWESGDMDFGADFRLKYSGGIWLAIKPESQARVTVTARSNRLGDCAEKVVASALAGFTHVDFKHWSFAINRQAQTDHIRLKVKKFTFYRLILRSVSASATATVLGADVKLRYAGNVK